MAKTLDSFPSPYLAGGRTAKYPWDEWLNGEIWQLLEGVDFQPKAHSFRVQVHHKAQTVGKTVRTQQIEGGLVIQAVPR